jgi:hypothetical protein
MIIDLIKIATLVTVIVTGVTQLIQIYFDYKRDQHSNSAQIYKVYESNCCSTVKHEEED